MTPCSWLYVLGPDWGVLAYGAWRLGCAVASALGSLVDFLWLPFAAASSADTALCRPFSWWACAFWLAGVALLLVPAVPVPWGAGRLHGSCAVCPLVGGDVLELVAAALLPACMGLPIAGRFVRLCCPPFAVPACRPLAPWLRAF